LLGAFARIIRYTVFHCVRACVRGIYSIHKIIFA
jgi:hypothetical protein